MKVHWLQHAQHEHLGCIEPWIRRRGHALSCTRLYEGETLPKAAQVDWLLILGGPMNVYEDRRYPWLKAEKRFINDAIVNNVPVLGICLGAQLIADVLGAKVVKNDHDEIGFFDVAKTDKGDICEHISDMPERFQAFHWHGDTFEVPPGAQHLYKSDACVNQAFSWGQRVLALQFHLEVARSDAQTWLDLAKPKPSRFVQTRQQILGDPQRFRANHRQMHHILERFAPL